MISQRCVHAHVNHVAFLVTGGQKEREREGVCVCVCVCACVCVRARARVFVLMLFAEHVILLLVLRDTDKSSCPWDGVSMFYKQHNFHRTFLTLMSHVPPAIRNTVLVQILLYT